MVRMDDTAQTPILTAEEMQDMTTLKPQTVMAHARAGRLPGVRISGSWRFHKVIVSDFIRDQALATVSLPPATPTQLPTSGRLLTEEDAAQWLRLGVDTFRRARRMGQIPFVAARPYVYPEDALLALFAENARRVRHSVGLDA